MYNPSRAANMNHSKSHSIPPRQAICRLRHRRTDRVCVKKHRCCMCANLHQKKCLTPPSARLRHLLVSAAERGTGALATDEPSAIDSKADRTGGIFINATPAVPVRIIATVDTSRVDAVAPVAVATTTSSGYPDAAAAAAATPSTFEVLP